MKAIIDKRRTKNCRTKEDCKIALDFVSIIAGNMYYDDVIGNGDYNEICDCIKQIRDIIAKEKIYYIGGKYAF